MDVFSVDYLSDREAVERLCSLLRQMRSEQQGDRCEYRDEIVQLKNAVRELQATLGLPHLIDEPTS